MLDKDTAINTLNAQALKRAKINADNFNKGIDKKLKYGEGKCARYVKTALIVGGASIKNSGIESAKDYGPWLIENNFNIVEGAVTVREGDVFTIDGQQTGDVVIIQAAPNHKHGHMAMFNGTYWVSDFVQEKGFYPAQIYRDQNIPYILYRYSDNNSAKRESSASKKKDIKIVWPIPASGQGNEFTSREEILAHLDKEPTGWYLLGNNAMWHGGIHITSTTTPWCALSGTAAIEAIDFPQPYKGEQAIRCMADGEVVAYRICRDYIEVPWMTGPMYTSGSFVLVRHYIQPGETEKSGLHFYTLYMHLAPYSAYAGRKNQWVVNDRLSAYQPEWVMVASAGNKAVDIEHRVDIIPAGSRIEWDAEDSNLHTTGYNGRGYGLVTFHGLSVKDKKKGIRTKLQEGKQYWILVDNNNIVPAVWASNSPSWWAQLCPPFAEPMQFDKVVCPTPCQISAGDSIGHLGFIQIPKETWGHDARYQLHIECLSADDNLPAFLQNPEKIGAPVYLKFPKGLPLLSAVIKTQEIVDENRVTRGEAIMKLSEMKSHTDARGKEYWFLPWENGYVPKGQTPPEQLLQYDLEKLGFVTIMDEPTTFDELDGRTTPRGLVRSIYQRLFEASANDPRYTHRAVSFNYQLLLNRIDSNISYYSPLEYLRAVHNPSYRDVKNRLIVKHPSEWYYKKEDSLWASFLRVMKKDAPEWEAYNAGWLDKLIWMQEAEKLKLGPSLWHMHPVEFLDALKRKEKIIWMKKFIEIFGAEKAVAFRAKLLEISTELNIDPNHIMACIALETSETFSTNIKNPGSSATGLIQFMKSTAVELGTTIDQLKSMDHVEQMEYVKKYFKMQAMNTGVPTEQWSLEDVYYATFSPKIIKLKDNDIVYQKSDGDTYNKNLYHDRNKDGKITKLEIAENIRIKYKKGILEAD